MEVNAVVVSRRRQVDRSAATRTALVGAARRLWAERGYADVGTEEIVHAAGVTRGALYHQFDDKVALFATVLEAVEQDVMGRLVSVVDAAAAAGVTDPVGLLVAGTDAWLDACADPEVQRIVLLDGPAVLGWERWREVGERYGMGLVATILTEFMDAGAIARQPVEPLAHVLIGALDEAALYVARAADPDAARAEVRTVLHRLVAVVAGPIDAP